MQTTEITTSNGKNTEKSLVGHVLSDLGGVLFGVELVDKTLSFASMAFKNNNFYQKSIKILRGLSPVVITGHKVYTSVNGYKEKQKQLYSRQKRNTTILRLMKLEHLEEYDLEYYDFNLGREIIQWIMHSPKTESFRIVEFYNSEFEIVAPKSFEKGEFYILIEYNNNKFMIEIDLNTMNHQIYITSCKLHTTSRCEKNNELKTKIFAEFIKSFNIIDNVIEMDSKGLQTRPRMKFDYNVYQFDVDSLKKEIENAVDKKKKRGYILIGPPGVGKSTVIIKLEKELPQIPIVYISSSASVFREDIENTFNFLRSINPCICIWEDLDGYCLESKQDKLFGEFIEQIDSLKHQECIIIIATMNQPELVHSSLINRRGRFDKVFFIDYPKSEEEIISVMKNAFMKETNKPFPFESIGTEIIERIISYNFSHADICEIIINLIINNHEISLENIKHSVNEIISSMEAIKQCSSPTVSYNKQRSRDDDD
jgi:adenylate kinase family enzyme